MFSIKFAFTGSSGHYNSTPASAASNIDPSSQTVSENRNNRRGLIGFGGGLRSRVSNAADVIRTMVQQVFVKTTFCVYCILFR